MIFKKTTTDYWFTIEPYTFIGLTNKCALLYNTLDGVAIESEKDEVIELLQETLIKENCGVVLLSQERYHNKEINAFIKELREKYMGDVIDVALSTSKPVQLLPFYNFPDMQGIYKRHNFSYNKNVLKYLSEINIHVDHTTNVKTLIPFLQSIPRSLSFLIVGNLMNVLNYRDLLSFFNQHSTPKYILCSYKNVIALQPTYENNYLYQISVRFPLNMKHWNQSRQLLLNQTLPVEYIIDVSCDDDCLQAGQFIEQFKIEKYRMNPVYTGDNFRFFEKNVFLSKEDILSTPMTIKDFFLNQAMNIHDFGKITIKPNGDAHANINYPPLGNIFTHSIYEIVCKEIEEGKSWFRIRNHAPCNDCVYQWLCPPPSNYEKVIGHPNLCHIKKTEGPI